MDGVQTVNTTALSKQVPHTVSRNLCNIDFKVTGFNIH